MNNTSNYKGPKFQQTIYYQKSSEKKVFLNFYTKVWFKNELFNKDFIKNQIFEKIK